MVQFESQQKSQFYLATQEPNWLKSIKDCAKFLRRRVSLGTRITRFDTTFFETFQGTGCEGTLRTTFLRENDMKPKGKTRVLSMALCMVFLMVAYSWAEDLILESSLSSGVTAHDGDIIAQNNCMVPQGMMSL